MRLESLHFAAERAILAKLSFFNLTRYGLYGPGSDPNGGEIFRVVQTGPGALPVSYTMGTGSLSEVKRPGRGVERPPTSSVEVKERVQLYHYSHSVLLWQVIGCTSPCSFTSSRSLVDDVEVLQ